MTDPQPDDATCVACEGVGYPLVAGVYRPCPTCGGTGIDAAVVASTVGHTIYRGRI